MSAPPPDECLVLRSAELEVVLLPGKGADIYAVVDRSSGVDLLFKTPWGWRDPRSLPPFGDSQRDWLARYAGGWQVLIPNAGPARHVDGTLRGYHGEAAVVPWQVHAADDRCAELTVDLITAPLRVSRTVTVTGPELRIRETIENLSPDPVPLMWVHHPAFGAPFIDEHARIQVAAHTIVSDAHEPGTLLPADRIAGFPLVDEEYDLRIPPPATVPRSVFAALTDFDRPGCTITSPTTGLAVELHWDAEVFPYAWFWQECHASAGYPWYRRAYVIAVEPANVLPGDGPVGPLRRGDSPLLAGGTAADTELTLRCGGLTGCPGQPAR
ncbi:MAG TPA: aldose 1-epimerase [Pseudonocardiaceae bacterium]|nr:aldose 1-epimerase [Pseudonocardiaceae bacterium]